VACLLDTLLNEARIVDLKVSRLYEIAKSCDVGTDFCVLFVLFPMRIANFVNYWKIRVFSRFFFCQTIANSIVAKEDRVEIFANAVFHAFQVSLFHSRTRRLENLVVLCRQFLH